MKFQKGTRLKMAVEKVVLIYKYSYKHYFLGSFNRYFVLKISYESCKFANFKSFVQRLGDKY